jgi:magnesium and cobalt exporter, CNNM family
MVIVLGLLLVVLVTAVTGYFVAQEFSYVAVDRARLRHEADAGDPAATRALVVTERLSFVLSGAQLGGAERPAHQHVAAARDGRTRRADPG